MVHDAQVLNDSVAYTLVSFFKSSGAIISNDVFPASSPEILQDVACQKLDVVKS